MGTQLPLPKGAQPPPQFSTHVCCGQMAAWIKMSLGMELGLGPGNPVLDGDPAPPKKKCLLWPNGWMDHSGTRHGGRPDPRRLCVRWGSKPFPQKGEPPPQFSAHFYCGQTAGCISNCVCAILINLTFHYSGRINLCASVDSSICTLITVALWNRAHHYIFILWFLLLLSSFFPCLISAVADWISAILPHMLWP